MSVPKAIFNLTLPVGRGMRPTGKVRLKIALGILTKIQGPADPDLAYDKDYLIRI